MKPRRYASGCVELQSLHIDGRILCNLVEEHKILTKLPQELHHPSLVTYHSITVIGIMVYFMEKTQVTELASCPLDANVMKWWCYYLDPPFLAILCSWCRYPKDPGNLMWLEPLTKHVEQFLSKAPTGNDLEEIGHIVQNLVGHLSLLQVLLLNHHTRPAVCHDHLDVCEWYMWTG